MNFLRGFKPVALESRLTGAKNVLTLGVRPNFSDYSREEREMILASRKVYYPGSLYAELFNSAGIPIFPSLANYLFAQDKIKQSALFALCGIPHPKTRVFYGKRQQEKILEYFSYPFIAKVPRGSSMGRGVFMIRNMEDLSSYLSRNRVAYVQEYLPIDRDFRIVVIGGKVVCAYLRLAPAGEFRTNISAGGRISFGAIPGKALELALTAARRCGFNDVGMDICEHGGSFYLIEANMKYGRQGFEKAGIDYLSMMDRMIGNDEI